jgi:mycothiol synthase
MTMTHQPIVPGLPGLTFRHLTAEDWDAVAAVQNASRRADGIDEVQTGASLAGEYPDSDIFQLERDSLAAWLGGSLVAFSFGFRAERDGVLVADTFGDVHPDHRRRGLGTALIRAQRARLAEEFETDPRIGPREHRAYALDEEVADRALYAAEGFVPIRFGFEMRRFLTGSLPRHDLPEGIELRPAAEADYRAIYDADNEAFEDHWGHRAPVEGDFQVRFFAPDANPSIWAVAWDGDRVAGVVMNAIFREENEALGIHRGWLEHVSVPRAYRGRGIAKALCAESFRILRAQGIDEAWLGVDAANPTGALGLYEGLGFHVVRRWQAFGRPLDRPAPEGWVSGS